ncbi:MAG: AraC family transcriptional regulator [Lachnospiraceae bacterium]|nr:AraC family transcriptional regulator [Lachnospiraceae bacterium]
MSFDNINSYSNLNIEYELPFYLRSTGYNDSTPVTEYPDGYLHHYICIVLEGKCLLKAGTYSFHLKKNDGFFIRAHFPFSYHPITKNCRTQWLTFNGYSTIPLFSRLDLQNYMIFHNLDCESLSYSLSQMYYISINNDLTSKLNNSALTYKFLIDIYTQSEQGIKKSDGAYNNNAFLYAKRYIDQFYMNDISQPQIADAAGITPQHLCRLFKKHLHMTPIRYLNEVRINQSQILLRKTSLSIVQIGEKVGFSTPHYFSGTFRRICGKTPSQYREIARIAANSN